jgi:16S rRNA (cytosine967-C5)-methyltransferase
MDKYLKLLPHKHQTDGFFAAVLERKPMAAKKPKAEAAEAAEVAEAADADDASAE